MTEIQKVIVGSQITALEPGLFKDMIALQEVDFKNASNLQIPTECFSGCESLTGCQYPTGSLACEDLTFFKCVNVEAVKLANTVTSVGLSSFYDCNKLSSVTSTGALTAISDNAFQNCNTLPILSIPNVTDIGDYAFKDCVQLTSVDRFDESKTAHLSAFETVGEYAFANTGVKKAVLTLRSSADRTWWGEYCFASCYNLENVTFLSSCYLGSHMFDSCFKLSSIEFKKGGISYVGKYVFKDCIALSTITFPKEQFSFLRGFFDGCSALQKVEFDGYGDGSQFCYVQKNVFNGCNKLSVVEFPETLNKFSKIEDAALSNCSLLSVTFHGLSKDDIMPDEEFVPQIVETGFFRLNHNCTIITKDGENLLWEYKPQKVKPYQPAYEYAADMATKSDFKTPYQLCNSYPTMKEAHRRQRNPWYYNVKEVVQQAKATGTPVLCFYSYESCTPCQAFKANIYESDEFQNWVKRQKFLICRIEADKPKTYDRELAYCEDTLSRDAVNYQKDGNLEPTNYNAFGNELGKGWFKDVGLTNKNLTPPVMVFYYVDNQGNVRAYHDYSLHSLDTYINTESIGVSGVIQMIKSLCLYHFDDNNLDAAKYVVEAGKPFNRKDYVLGNPYAIPGKPNAIQIDDWDGLIDKTVNGVMTKMRDVLGGQITESASYPGYIGGCLFGEIDWISRTFNTNELQSVGVNEQNAILDKIFIFIGGDSYKLQLDPADATSNEVLTPCGLAILYKYKFSSEPYSSSI